MFRLPQIFAPPAQDHLRGWCSFRFGFLEAIGERRDDLMKGRRLLSEGQRAGAIDDVELRDALLLRDAAKEPQAVVERRQGIVAAPDDLARHLDSLGAANLVEARLRFHHAWYELVRVALRRHRPMVARRRDASA